MDIRTSSYFMLLFNSPGPSDIKSEAKRICLYLRENNQLYLAKGFKMKIRVESVNYPTNFEKLAESMQAWLDGEDKALLVNIKQVGIEAHGKRFGFFQAGWTITLKDEAEVLDRYSPEIEETISAALQEYKINKAQNGGIFGRVFGKLFIRNTKDK